MKILFPDALDPFPLPASREEKNSAEQDARLRSDDVWYVLQELEKRVGSILSTDAASLTCRIGAVEEAIASGSITTSSPAGSGSSDVGLGSANQVFGMDAGGTVYEWKTLAEGSNISIVHGAGTITISASLAGGGYATIQEEGTPLTQRVALNFIGPFTAADDAPNARTNVTLTGAALTKTNDTNVTLTLGGTPASALLAAASITAGWTGQLSAARGGTGVDTSAWNGYPRVASGVWSSQAYIDNALYIAIAEGNTSSNVPMIDASVQWNAGGITFSGWRMNVTDTASTAGSLLVDLMVGGNPIFSLRKDGAVTVGAWQGTAVTGQYGGTGVNNSGKTITLGGNFATSGAFALTFTLTGTTGITLPTSGTLLTTTSTIDVTHGGTGQDWSGVTVGAVPWFSDTGVMGVVGGSACSVLVSGSSPGFAVSWANAGANSNRVLLSNGIVGAPSWSSNALIMGGTVNFAGAVTLAGAFTTSGAYGITLTATNTTSITLPTAGTLAILGANTFTANQTLANGMKVVFIEGTTTGQQYVGTLYDATSGLAQGYFGYDLTGSPTICGGWYNAGLWLAFTKKTYLTGTAATTDKTITFPNYTGIVALLNNSTFTSTCTWNGAVVGPGYGGTGVDNTGKTITLGGNFTTSGAFALTITLTAATGVTFPTSGTLVNSAVTTLSSLVSIGTITTGIWNAGAITSTGAIISTLAAGNALIIDTSVLVADATNNRVGVNDATPTVDLSVNGQLNCFGGLSSSFTNTVVGAGGVIVAGSVCQVLIMKRGVTNIGSTTAGDKFAWYTDGTGFKLWTYATDLLYVTPTGTLQTTGGVLSSSASAGVGYAAGAGGTQPQSSSKSTGVTLNKVCGTITMNGAALAADTTVAFTLTNSSIAATDEVVVVHSSVGTLGAYTFAVTPASGSAVISVHNCTPGSLSEAIVIRFFVLKAVTS